MDVRKSQEYVEAKARRDKEMAEKELAARHVLTILHESNTARDKVFAENKIGTQGFLPITMFFGIS